MKSRKININVLHWDTLYRNAILLVENNLIGKNDQMKYKQKLLCFVTILSKQQNIYVIRN